MKPLMMMQTSVWLTALLTVASCGGGEKASPTAALSPTATFTPVAAAPSPAASAAPRPSPTVVPSPQAVATARPQPTAAGPVGKLTVAYASFSNEVLRPSKGRYGGTQTYLAPMFDWLIHAKSDGSPTPGIARQWEMAPDGKSWTLIIRDDMRFHNGDPLTAEDVKFSFDNTIVDVKEGGGATFGDTYVASVDSVAVVSPTAVRVNLSRPWPLFPLNAMSRAGPAGAIVPKGYYQRVGGNGFDKAPVGSGPWKFVRHSVGVRILLEASGIPHPFRQAPKFKELELVLIPEESTRIAMLKTGGADLVDIASPDSAGALRKAGELQVFNIPDANVGVMYIFGIDDPRIKGLPTANRDVRHALLLGINRPEIVETVFGGFAKLVARDVAWPGADGYDPSLKAEEYAPVRAKELLARAGYAQGFRLTVFNFPGPGVPWLSRMAEAVVGYWQNLGIDMRVIPTDFAAVGAMYRARPQAGDLIGQSSPSWVAVTPSNLGSMFNSYHSKGLNGLIQRPEVDALIDRAFTEIDVQKRQELVRQVLDLGYSEYYSFPIASGALLMGAGKRVGGAEPVASFGLALSFETVTPK